MTRALIIGATGYVGAAVARALTARGCLVSGLARQQGNRAVLTAAGVEPIDGDLADGERLAELVEEFDIVVFAPMIPFVAEPPALRAIIAGLGRNDSRRRHLLFTSGSGVVSTESRDGRWNEDTAAEDDPFTFPSLPTRDIREVIERDLVDTELTFVNAPWLQAYFTPAEQHSAEMKEALRLSDELVAELLAADHLVIATPVYNYNVPAALKAWVDHIVWKGLTLGLDGRGLVAGKKATVLLASGGVYTEASPIRDRDIRHAVSSPHPQRHRHRRGDRGRGRRGEGRRPRCLIPRFDGAILSQGWKDAVWDRFVMGAPRPRTLSEQQYSDRKLRSRR